MLTKELKISGMKVKRITKKLKICIMMENNCGMKEREIFPQEKT